MKFLEYIRSAWLFIRKNPSIAYSLILLIIIPAFLVGYTLWTVDSFQTVLTHRLERESILTHQVIEEFLTEYAGDEKQIQKRLDGLRTRLTERLADYSVAVPADDGTFTVVASFDESAKNESLKDAQYTLAWTQRQPIATTVEERSQGERFLVVARPLSDGNQPWAIGIVTTSLQEHDILVSEVMTRLIFVLVIAALAVILLIGNHARMLHFASDLKRQKEIDQTKDDFISVASHELRTPITGVRSFLSLLEEGTVGDLNEEGKKYVHEALEHTDKLNELVNDMLDVSRIEQGRMEFTAQSVNPVDVVREVMRSLAFRAREKGLALNLAHTPERPFTISVDPDHFRRIVTNLLGNALKYTSKGEMTVSFSDRQRDKVTITIRDTGIGIPPEEVKTLFKKFSRVHTDETAKVQGTGLGLWITKALTERMGGEIYVSSIYGQGTEFTLVFPIIETASTQKGKSAS